MLLPNLKRIILYDFELCQVFLCYLKVCVDYLTVKN